MSEDFEKLGRYYFTIEEANRVEQARLKALNEMRSLLDQGTRQMDAYDYNLSVPVDAITKVYIEYCKAQEELSEHVKTINNLAADLGRDPVSVAIDPESLDHAAGA